MQRRQPSPRPRREPEHFDADYYRRFYRDPKTRVASAAATARLAEFVVAYLRYLQLPLRSTLDLGCGLGLWQRALAAAAPRASYRGVEHSDYLCRKLGWTRGSVVDHDPGRTFDLVVCQGVLQYLGDRDAARAIDNLARVCHGALYLEALTRRDWRENCDRQTTDGDVHLRAGDWYRRRLRRHFTAVGGGLFIRHGAPATMFELETT